MPGRNAACRSDGLLGKDALTSALRRYIARVRFVLMATRPGTAPLAAMMEVVEMYRLIVLLFLSVFSHPALGWEPYCDTPSGAGCGDDDRHGVTARPVYCIQQCGQVGGLWVCTPCDCGGPCSEVTPEDGPRPGDVWSPILGGYHVARTNRMVVIAEWDCWIDYDGWYTCEQVWP